MSKKLYAIIDVETTGGRADRDKITEIAIALHDGEKTIDTFSSLVNPERSIPYNITKITGITNEMVSDAPKFYEIAKEVVEMTKDAIFVAHNVRFDYGFIREEFKRLGFTYTRKKLCTVKMSRKVFPKIKRYSLENLIRHFKIQVQNRHRALDDVLATVVVFEKILDAENNSLKHFINRGIKESKLPNNITLEFLQNLPEACGVYYFYNELKEVVYVGKSINIKRRVMDHFADQTRKGERIQQQVHGISYTLTGSELVALLLESDEIKKLQPRINRAQRAVRYPYVIHHYENQEGYICLDIARVTAKTRDRLNIVAEFAKAASAKGHLKQLLYEYQLCLKLCNLENGRGKCFYRQIDQCFGACESVEPSESYNERVQEANNALDKTFAESFFLVEEGREVGEKAVVLVEAGIYRGFGFIEEDLVQGTIEDLKEVIKDYQNNKDTLKIIRNYIRNKKVQKIVF